MGGSSPFGNGLERLSVGVTVSASGATEVVVRDEPTDVPVPRYDGDGWWKTPKPPCTTVFSLTAQVAPARGSTLSVSVRCVASPGPTKPTPPFSPICGSCD